MAFNTETARAAGKKSTRAGTPNKVSGQLRDLIAEIVETNLGQLQKDLEAMEPTARVNAILKMADLVLPKRQTISGDGDGIPIETVIRFIDDTNDESILEGINPR